MNILVVGSGGREHTLVWKLAQSRHCPKMFCAPGNAGIAQIATCVDIPVTDFQGLAAFAKENAIDLTVVGPDDALAGGIVDVFTAAGLRAFGPTKDAAQIESSKAFSKGLMQKHGIPTAAHRTFAVYDDALAYVRAQAMPIVVKADGLALGKGVLMCYSLSEAEAALQEMFLDKKFGASGDVVVIEECLVGPEVSVLAFCDGETVRPMVSAQDHKRAFDNDQGPNTGGMGTFSPSRVYTKEMEKLCMETIFEPTVQALRSEGICFKGIIYFGLMLTERGPMVIEYNARFGDPETQVVLPRMKTDFVDVLEACIDGTLDSMDVAWDDGAAACVVVASGGYPGSYAKGHVISGLAEAQKMDNLTVFHAGTALADGEIVTAGGRVLGVTGTGEALEAAIRTAYEGVAVISFEGARHRSDIGIK